jgi:uncharacterized protein with FMN-binding domain
MKKIIVSVLLVGAIVVYVIFRSTTAAPSAVTTDTSGVPTPPGGTSVGSETLAPPPQTTPVSTTKGPYKDGTYTGDAVDAFYGIVQVQATVSGGVLTKIALLKEPNDREHTIEISNSSLPVLKQEAIAAQSAKIDIVSGATQTSEGFIASLASALVKAKS